MKRIGLMVVACAVVLGVAAVGTRVAADKPQQAGGAPKQAPSSTSGQKGTTTQSASPDKGPQAKTGSSAQKDVPKDATGQCNDGTWSTADSKQGACSGHGGVKKWYGKAPADATARCHDGSFSKATSAHGACSSHGGVGYWIHEPKGGEAKH
ncbi:MAG TPA: DUF3761 domain-containing protein [Candidatus Polarisedimenticolia bacterium]|jgi:hypothetical protein|nr:DUF3761 domain-containing protein [Candidatus Polarisedimenticolia bacterium]